MFIRFVDTLRAYGIPVSLSEHLTLLAALQAGLHHHSAADFRDLARTILVKQERHLARFEEAFDFFFSGAQQLPDAVLAELDAAWRAAHDTLKGPDAPATLLEQAAADAGADANLLANLPQPGQDGTEGQAQSGQERNGRSGRGGTTGARRSLSGRWDGQNWKELQDDQQLGTRNLQVALRALRRLTREGTDTELDLPATIRATGRNAGLLDVRMRPPRKNHVKVLLLLDTGGSMDSHTRATTELFSAARHTFQRLEAYYFHNFVYDAVWHRVGQRNVSVPVADLVRKHRFDTKLVIVGDASMNPFEILDTRSVVDGSQGQAIRLHEQPAFRHLALLQRHFAALVWLNPEPQRDWDRITTVRLIRQFVGGRMYPLHPAGIAEAVRALRKPPPLRPGGNLGYRW